MPWIWAEFGTCIVQQNVAEAMLKSAKQGLQEACHDSFLTGRILIPPYKEDCTRQWRRRDPVESDPVFPATSTELSNHSTSTNPPADHRYLENSPEISQANPDKTRPGIWPKFHTQNWELNKWLLFSAMMLWDYLLYGKSKNTGYC